MSCEERLRTIKPDFKIMYTYDFEPFASRSPLDDKVSVTLQATQKENVSHAHGYFVRRSTINKVIKLLEDDSETQQSEISLCPFCESSCHAEKFVNGKWYVECNYCGATTAPLFDNREDAIEFWNHHD